MTEILNIPHAASLCPACDSRT